MNAKPDLHGLISLSIVGFIFATCWIQMLIFRWCKTNLDWLNQGDHYFLYEVTDQRIKDGMFNCVKWTEHRTVNFEFNIGFEPTDYQSLECDIYIDRSFDGTVGRCYIKADDKLYLIYNAAMCYDVLYQYVLPFFSCKYPVAIKDELYNSYYDNGCYVKEVVSKKFVKIECSDSINIMT